MPIIIGENSHGSNAVIRQIQCPGHYMIPPQIDVYLREPEPLLKDCSDFVEFKGKKTRIKKMRIVKDRFGNKVIDWKKIWELGQKGIIQRPWVTAGWAIEHVWDPMSLLCRQCGGRCKRGRGPINEFSIKRLHTE